MSWKVSPQVRTPRAMVSVTSSPSWVLQRCSGPTVIWTGVPGASATV